MTQRKNCTVIFIAIFLLTGLFCIKPLSVNAKEKILKLTTAYVQGEEPLYSMITDMADRFNKRAQGQYKIVVYPGGSLAKLPEFFDVVRIGLVEIQYSNWGMFSFLEPSLSLLETPFLFNNNTAAAEGTKQMLPLFDTVLQEKLNAKALNMCSHGALSLISQKPINSLEDLNGLLVAAVSPGNATMLQKLGAAPVTIPFTDIYEALQKKIVDAVSMNGIGSVKLSFVDLCKYYTAYYGTPAPAGFTINLDVWKKMPPDMQQALLEETEQAGEYVNRVMSTTVVDEVLDTYKKKNVSIFCVPAEERKKWADKFESQNQETFKKFGIVGQKMKEIVDQVNQKYPYIPNNDIL